MTNYTYTVREPGMTAWETDLATTDDALAARGAARDRGLKRATIYAVPDDGGEPVEVGKLREWCPCGCHEEVE